MTKKICLTFDIEDWFQVENLRTVFPPETWDDQELRVERNTYKILELLDRYNVKATFFVLGWIAERVPHLVKKISKQGHEIASHGYNHILNYKLSEAELKRDLESSKKLLEDLTGQEVIGYRAPSFSITDKLLYLLKELGYKYDSSFNDFAAHDRYGKVKGVNGSKKFKHEAGIYEVPMPVVNFLGRKIPISGGGYFRLMPKKMFMNLVKKYLKTNPYYIFYLHPWEIDENQPKVKKLRLFYRIRHYSNIKKSFSKIEKLVHSFKLDDDFQNIESKRMIDII